MAAVPKTVLALDVDLTVVDTLTPWLAWFKYKTGIDFTPHLTEGQYDLVPQMRKLSNDLGLFDFDPFEYWHDKTLYDMLEPMDGVVEAVNDIMTDFKDQVELAFISHCVPAHENSKRRFLSKHFPAHSFVSTSEKWLIDYDILVDDNVTLLEKALIHRRNKAFHVAVTCWEHSPTAPEGAIPFSSWRTEVVYNLVRIDRAVKKGTLTLT